VSAFWNIWGAPLPSAVPLIAFDAVFPSGVLSGERRRSAFFSSFSLGIVTIEDVDLVITTDVSLWQSVADYALGGGSFSPVDCRQGLFL
jgi:hypothetical protein